MSFKPSSMACAMALVFPVLSVAPAIGAGTAETELPAVVVTANPLGSGLFELVPPVSVMEGQGLTLKKRSTLGETLADLPGMSSTGYGPAASRPVIRGLDGDRIRILQNGVGMLDASSLSFDHAVAADPMMMDRVEVVRGPAALLYGGSAVGGVVNIIDNRIPQDPIEGVQGRAEVRLGGAERERGGGAAIEAGNGRLTLHADGHTRRTGDLKIRGPAVSSRLRALSDAGQRDVPRASLDANGHLPNSASKSDGGAVGASVVWDKGLFGLSYSEFGTNYGAVAEPGVTIDMKSNRWDFAGELRDLGSFSALKFKHGRTDYEHKELDAGVVGTTFRNKGSESRLEAVHSPLGPFTGSVGLQYNNSDFSALGAEAFVPSTRTDSRALFFFEELPVGTGRLKLNFGGRTERNTVVSSGGGNIPTGQTNPRFGPEQTRSFSATSTAAGALYSFTRNIVLAVNLSATQRAPTATELYANGPHAATGAYEVGDATLDKERSRSVDVTLRMRSGPDSASIGLFHTRFRNFITEFITGAERGADGEVAPVDAGDRTSTASGEEILREVAFRAVPAVFRGIEAQGRYRLSESGGTWDLELRADHTRAYNADTGASLPRIAPLRFGGSLLYALNNISTRLDVTRVQGQGRVSANELSTDGYTLVNAYAGYRFKSMSAQWEAFLRASNLLNVEARNHVSFIKDIAPLPGRGIMAGLRGSF